MFAYFLQKGVDPHQPDFQGDTPVHIALRSLDTFLPMLSSAGLLTDLTDSPAGIFREITYSCGNGMESQSIRRFCRAMAKHGLVSLLNAYPSRPGSALCAAASFGNVPIIRIFLDFGANLEMEGSKEGTALMSACACGRLEAVKELVRIGARISYVNSKGEQRSAVGLAHLYPRIVHWLIAERFYDRRRISNGPANPGPEVKCWSGRATARYPLAMDEVQRWYESPLDALRRLKKLKEGLGGSVVRVEVVYD